MMINRKRIRMERSMNEKLREASQTSKKMNGRQAERN